MQAFKLQMVAPTVKFEGWGGAYRGAVKVTFRELQYSYYTYTFKLCTR